MKKILIALSLLVIVGIVIGGFVMKQHEEKQRMIEIATSDEAKKAYEVGFDLEKPNSNKVRDILEQYEISKESLKYNPMGGLMVKVIINGDSELTISYNLIDDGNGKYYSAYYIYSRELSYLLKIE